MANKTPNTRNDQTHDTLEPSFEKATAKTPETFRDEANAEKEVHIPADKTKKPIRGIDAPEDTGRGIDAPDDNRRGIEAPDDSRR